MNRGWAVWQSSRRHERKLKGNHTQAGVSGICTLNDGDEVNVGRSVWQIWRPLCFSRQTDSKANRQEVKGTDRGSSRVKTDSLSTLTYRQGLQPLFVELSLLTRHPEGGSGGEGGERRTRGEIWEDESLSKRCREHRGEGGRGVREAGRGGGVSRRGPSSAIIQADGEQELRRSRDLSLSGHVPHTQPTPCIFCLYLSDTHSFFGSLCLSSHLSPPFLPSLL